MLLFEQYKKFRIIANHRVCHDRSGAAVCYFPQAIQFVQRTCRAWKIRVYCFIINIPYPGSGRDCCAVFNGKHRSIGRELKGVPRKYRRDAGVILIVSLYIPHTACHYFNDGVFFLLLNKLFAGKEYWNQHKG